MNATKLTKLTDAQRAAMHYAETLGGFGIVDPDPMLLDLIALGYASSRWVGSGDGPPYLFYDLTPEGHAALRGES